MFRAASIVALVAMVSVSALAQPAAAPAPKAPAEFLIGEMHVQSLPAIDYLHQSHKTTFAGMKDPIEKTLGAVAKGAKEGKAMMTGAALFIYKGIDPQDMAKEFTMEVGYIVDADAKPWGDLKVRKTEPCKCATILMVGSVQNIGKAYEKLMPQVMAAGLQPTGETREMYLYWEGMDSKNNITQIQVLVK